MIKKLAIIISLFCLSFNALAQADVKGYALRYLNKSQGILGVTIMRENGQGDTTDSKGFFNIKFPGELDRRQGRLKVLPPKIGECRNYVVMEVDGYYYIKDVDVTIGRIDTVKISLCPPEEFERMVLKLVKPYLDKELLVKNNRITELNEENRQLNLTSDEKNKRLQHIEYEYEILKVNYMELARKFARIDTAFADDNLKNARRYFDQGDIENAKKCLPEYENARNYIERGKAVMSLWLSIWKVEGDIYGALQAYYDIEKYTGIEEDKCILLKERSEYLFQNKMFDASFIEIALKDAKKAKKYALYFLPIRYQVSLYNLLGRIQKEQNEADYYKNYDTAITIYNRYKQDTLARFAARKDIAISYTSRADYYKDKAKTQRAIGSYRKALDIYIEMSQDKEYDNANYMNMLINLATCYVEGRKDILVNQCKDRINILSKKIDMTFEDSVRIYTAMGTFSLANNEYGDALSYYSLVSNICIKKEQRTPLYKDKTIGTVFLTGLAHNYTGNFQKSIDYCNFAENKIGKESTKYQLMLGYIYALKANSYKHLNDNVNSKNFFSKANGIAKTCQNDDLDSFIRYAKHENLYLYIGNKKFNIQSGIWITLLGVGSFAMLI